MKRVVFMIIPALICGFVCTSCSSNKDETSKGELYAMGSKSKMGTDAIPDPEEGRNPDYIDYSVETQELVFTGRDIRSFNVTTNEIIFTSKVAEKLKYNGFRVLSMYLNDEPLFENEIRINCPVDSYLPWGYVMLCLEWDFDEALNKWVNPKFHLSNCERHEQGYGEMHEYDPIKRKKDWDNFIGYLNNVNKIIR